MAVATHRRDDPIIVLTQGGQELVRGEVHGHLAIHESVTGDDTWTVTHTGSGLAVCTRLTRNAALDLVAELNNHYKHIFGMDEIDIDMTTITKVYGEDVVNEIRLAVSKARSKVH